MACRNAFRCLISYGILLQVCTTVEFSTRIDSNATTANLKVFDGGDHRRIGLLRSESRARHEPKVPLRGATSKEESNQMNSLVKAHSLLQRRQRQHQPQPLQPKQGYIWHIPGGKRSVMLSHAVARRAAGPLTLARLLSGCRHAPVDEALAKLQKRGHVRLHVVGAIEDWEPSMNWSAYLQGNLHARGLHGLEQKLSRLFGLTPTFAGLKLSIMFNGFNVGTDFEEACRRTIVASGWANHRSITTECISGTYREASLRSRLGSPDFAFLMNAGLHQEPTHWRNALQPLLRSKIPFVVTDYHYDSINVKPHGSEWWRLTQGRTRASVRVKPPIKLGARRDTDRVQRITFLPMASSRSSECSPSARVLDEDSQAKILLRFGAHVLAASYPNPFIYVDGPDSGGPANAIALLAIGADDSSYMHISDLSLLRHELLDLVRQSDTDEITTSCRSKLIWTISAAKTFPFTIHDEREFPKHILQTYFRRTPECRSA
eukprot:TRINITY_DN56359_c0_g1_i1.p1 TRINITY_DN56359_c0_g1~~TRINITY_DN56359_c0_g1_i1.p1  ORF type:complete len:489 (+),score=38.41 TRINITY_DN56359_c0_g1_i1:52-1518(+)